MSKSRGARNGSRRAALRSRLKAQGLPCALCGAPIDYSLPAGHPLSFEADEIVPVALGGDELDWENLQPTHRICNQAKGKRVNPVFAATGVLADSKTARRHRAPSPPRCSRDWAA